MNFGPFGENFGCGSRQSSCCNFNNMNGAGNFGFGNSSGGFGYPHIGGGQWDGGNYASVVPNPGVNNPKYNCKPIQHVTLDWGQALGGANGMKVNMVGQGNSQMNCCQGGGPNSSYEAKVLSITPVGSPSMNGMMMNGNGGGQFYP